MRFHAAASAQPVFIDALESCAPPLYRLQVLPPAAFQSPMLEKLIWISAFMLVGARNGGCTVGDVESKHTGEVTRHPHRRN